MPIVDDLEIEDEEEFTVRIPELNLIRLIQCVYISPAKWQVHISQETEPAGTAVVEPAVHTVFIQDNDSPGMFVFVKEIIKVQESDGVAVVQV